MTSPLTFLAAAARASIRGTQSARVSAVSAPIAPPVVSPRCQTTMSAPASVMAVASASLKT